MTTVTTLASQSLFVIITGAVNTGKSYQITSLLTAHVDGEPVATPTLFLLAEASGEGTAAEVLNDPGLCCVWPVADCDEAIEALQECLSKAGPVTLGEAKRRWHKVACRRVADENLRALAEDKSARPMDPPPPLASSPRDGIVLRSVVVDTGTSLYQGSINTYVRNSMAEAEKKQKGSSKDRSGKKDAPWNNSMNTNAFAALPLHPVDHAALRRLALVGDDAVGDALGGGRVEIVSRHVGQVGHVVEAVPDHVGLAREDRPGGGVPVRGKAHVTDLRGPERRGLADDDLLLLAALRGHEAHGRPGVHSDQRDEPAGVLRDGVQAVGECLEAGGGEGPWSIFDSLPMYWHPNVKCDPATAAFSPTPNIGKVVAFALKAARSAA